MLRTENDFFLLEIPPVPYYSRTERAFSYAAPRIWNNLPYDIRTCYDISKFKNELKTHYFNKAFNSKIGK